MRLQARGLTKAYGSITVLDEVSVEVEAGEVRALLGENGAGKSTLIKALSGAVTPDRGVVYLEGTPLPVSDPLAVRRRGVSVVYQEFTLVPHLTVTENIFLGREVGRPLLNTSDMRRQAQGVLDDLGIAVPAGAMVRDLSVAHQQMVEIARALVTEASVLVLDEPSATLSNVEVDTLFRVIRRLRDRGLAIIYVSHRLDEIFAIADSVTVLRDGRHVITAPVSAFTRDSLIRHMVGRDLTEEFPARDVRPGDVALRVRALAAEPRCSAVTLDVHAGEIVGLAGLVGAGRTSAALAMVGALRATGIVEVDGVRRQFRSPSDAIAHGLAYVTEDRKGQGLFAALSVDENITMTHLRSFARAGWLSRAAARRVAAEAVRDFDIRTATLSQPAGTLSGGNQQKTLVARYLVRPPRVLILDEPTRGVDVGARAEIYRTMNRLTTLGLGILMISSDLPEVIGMADRIVVMRGGRTVGEVGRADATPERVMALAAAG
ncbi:MAG: sugar ABC transporter ATP-binding protein [Acidobacteriota bacterium]